MLLSFQSMEVNFFFLKLSLIPSPKVMAKYSSISAQTLSLQGNLGSWNCPWEIIVFSFLHLRAVNLVGLLKGQCLPQRYVIFNSLIFKLYGPPYDCIKIQKSQKKKKRFRNLLVWRDVFGKTRTWEFSLLCELGMYSLYCDGDGVVVCYTSEC